MLEPAERWAYLRRCADVRFWHKADMVTVFGDVRFWGFPVTPLKLQVYLPVW